MGTSVKVTTWRGGGGSALTVRVPWPPASASPDQRPRFPSPWLDSVGLRRLLSTSSLHVAVQAGPLPLRTRLCFPTVTRSIAPARAVAALVLVACCWGCVLCWPVVRSLQNACSGVAKVDGGPV